MGALPSIGFIPKNSKFRLKPSLRRKVQSGEIFIHRNYLRRESGEVGIDLKNVGFADLDIVETEITERGRTERTRYNG